MQLGSIEVQVEAAVKLTVLLSALPLLPSLVVGLVSSVLQAATQIQDQSLTFVPKVVAVCAVLFFLGPTACAWYAQFVTELLYSLGSSK